MIIIEVVLLRMTVPFLYRALFLQERSAIRRVGKGSPVTGWPAVYLFRVCADHRLRGGFDLAL